MTSEAELWTDIIKNVFFSFIQIHSKDMRINYFMKKEDLTNFLITNSQNDQGVMMQIEHCFNNFQVLQNQAQNMLLGIFQ